MPTGIYIRTKGVWKHSEETKEKIRQAHLSKKHTDETKKKMSEAHKSKKLSKETKNKLSLINKGKILSEDHKQKIGKAQIGRNSSKKGKTYEELYGKEKANKLRESHSKVHKNKKVSEVVKVKIRQAAVKRVLLNNGKFPAYNSEGVAFFKSFDKQHNTNGQYATNPNEFYIKELGYWPDYINFDKKIIIEIDEKFHEKQKEKDVIRENKIKEFYPDFKFLRFKDIEINKTLELKIKQLVK